ncbi:arsenate reductase (glutaredoxin) [Pseudomonas sp. PD9R]|uniref:arsenate reductase (glutaredoxin) n=1 Tax=Pseudomonas sp. PD9R TaxID=2853534 RepID=UPI001C455B37|nr:arsenate reductase (glutaredoxin) [Pseudomonas sp. PD9R]MBV6826493.1 arsenate reductase (glutaredoxin) [Pseudomonas sp. PD9R]
MSIIIYHAGVCTHSRGALELLRRAGFEPDIVEYLVNPLDRQVLLDLLKRAGLSVRDIIRIQEQEYKDLGLDDKSLSDEVLLDAIDAHPILMNRPLVATPLGVRLCRPAELVLEILPKD